MVAEIGIFVFGASAVILVGTKSRWMKWGYVFGLCSCPFWYWTAIANRQWGICLVNVLYTIGWANGVRNHFGKGK